MKQRYEVPGVLGTTCIYTDNPPVGATLVQDYQDQPPVNKPSLEQRIEVLEKAVSNINERLGIKTDSGSVDFNTASKLLENLDSSAATKATNELANSNNGVTNAATVISAPTDPASASSSTTPTDPSSASSASSASAPIPSADDIAKQLGDLT